MIWHWWLAPGAPTKQGAHPPSQAASILGQCGANVGSQHIWPVKHPESGTSIKIMPFQYKMNLFWPHVGSVFTPDALSQSVRIRDVTTELTELSCPRSCAHQSQTVLGRFPFREGPAQSGRVRLYGPVKLSFGIGQRRPELRDGLLMERPCPH